MSVTTDLPTLPETFSKSFAGRVIGPADADYESLREVFYAGADKRPGIILRPQTTEDVVAAVSYARDSGRELAVRSGGHSGAGHSTTEGGIVIDVRDLAELDFDAGTKTVWAGSGLTAGAVSKAADERGLAIGFGDAATVGIGGITTGGGVGYLVRRFGLTIDNLLAAEIVTADGRIHLVDEEHEPDLFWAIRGGGGNFGVVTRFRFRLAEMPAFTGGMLALPATGETVAGFVAAAQAAPDELSAIGNVMPAPPMPFLAPEHHGKLIIMAMIAYAGDDAAAVESIKPFRALATPLADFVKPGSYMQMFPPEDPGYKPLAVSKNLFAPRIDRAMGQTIVDYLLKSDAPMRVAQLRVLGGASARIPDDATAYGHRQQPIMVNVAAFYDGTPAGKAKQTAWMEAFASELSGGGRGAYVNFVGDEGPERVRDAYPGPTWDRLRQLKKRYDPNNLFRLNQNIPPAA